MKIRKFFAAIITVIIGFGFAVNTTFAGDVQPPPVGESDSSVAMKLPTTVESTSTATKISKGGWRGSVSLQGGDPYVGANIWVVPYISMRTNHMETARQIELDFQNKTLSTTSGYQLSRGHIEWENLASSPSSDWEQLRLLVVIRSKNGKDNLSLSQMRVSSVSTGNALNDIYGVGSNGYGPAAWGVMANGDLIESGSPEQKCSEIYIVVTMKAFNGGSQDALNNIRSYVLDRMENFTVNYQVMIEGDGASIGKATVSIRGYDDNWPKLVPVKNANGISLMVIEGDSNRAYKILSASEADGTYVAEINLPPVYSGDRWRPLINRQQPKRFFRLKTAGW